MGDHDKTRRENLVFTNQFERRIAITRQPSPGLLPTFPKALSAQTQGTSTFPSATSSAGLANTETKPQKPGDNDVDARKANRSEKALGRKSNPEAKKVEAEAKRATAKAELEEIGKQIAARVAIMRNYDAAAEEKAGHDLRKAQDERDTINNVLLVEARAKCKESGESFERFRKQYCPDLSRSRLYAVLAIADGRKTVAQDRAEKRESVAKSRAKMSSTVPVGDIRRASRVATPNGTTLDTSGFSPKTLEKIVKVTGNDVDTEASAEARKAAALEPEPSDTGDGASAPDDGLVGHLTPGAVNQKPGAVLTADELSDDALSGFKKACDQFLPAMTVVEDRRRACVYFMTACDKLDNKARTEAA
jgi:hypothetical protein